MKIPKTTENEPYIEFRVDKKGKLKLSKSSLWWGGINGSFWGSDGSQGNSCKPKDLKRCLEAFKKNKIKKLEKEVLMSQKRLEKMKILFDNLDL